MRTEDQAEGLQDWARFRYLDSLEYLNEDEGWEHSVLRDKLGIPKPPRVLYYNRPLEYHHRHGYTQNFLPELWADEIRAVYLHELTMSMVARIDQQMMEKLNDR